MFNFLFSYSHKVRDLSVVHPVSRPSGWTLGLFVFLMMFSFVSAADPLVIGDGVSSGVEIILPVTPPSTNVTSNSTDFWNTNIGTLGGVNTTQFSNNGGLLNILESFLTTFGNGVWCALTGCDMVGDINMTNNSIVGVRFINATSITADVGNFTTLFTSNGTLFIGNVSISSFNNTLQVEPGKLINASFLAGDGSQLFNLDFNVTNGSASFSNITSGDYFGGNYTGDNFTGKFAFFERLKVGDLPLVGNALIEIDAVAVNSSESICGDTIACYRYEEGSGLIAVDSSNISNNGVLRDSIFQASKGGNGTGNFSMFFDSSFPAYNYIPDIPQLNLTDNFAISLWVRRNDSDHGTLISKLNDPSSSNGYLLKINNLGRVEFITREDGTFTRQRTSGVAIPFDGVWRHIIASIDTGSITIYIDGVSVGTAGSGHTLATGSLALIIGAESDLTSEAFFGNMDEVGIFMMPINSTQATEIFNNGFNISNQTVVRASEDYFRVGGVNGNGNVFLVSQVDKIGILTSSPQFDVDINGSQLIRDTLFVSGDIIVQGNIIGGSPVKILGGFEVITGDVHIGNGSLHLHNQTLHGVGDLYATNITANEFIDLTPAYPGTAEEALSDIIATGYKMRNGRREVNHSTYSDFMRYNNTRRNTEGRSLGAVISTLQEAVRGLFNRQNNLRSRINELNATVISQQIKINAMEAAICRRHPNDPFCN